MYVAAANYGLPLLYGGPTSLIVVVHDLIPLRLPRTHLVPRPAWAVKYLISTTISVLRSTLVVANSESTARDVRKIFHKTALRIAYPPLPPARSQRAEGPPGGLPPKYFVYAGGYDARKNVPVLLRSFALFRAEVSRTIRLVLLGEKYAAVTELIGSLGLNDSVHQTGYVDDETKFSVIRGSIAVVHPSTTEGFGIPLVEAFASDVPVVCGTGGALREVGGNAPIYVDGSSVQSICSGLVDVCNPERRCALIERGRQRLSAICDESIEYNAVKAIASLWEGTQEYSGRDRQ